jgi:hypothetical protein
MTEVCKSAVLLLHISKKAHTQNQSYHGITIKMLVTIVDSLPEKPLLHSRKHHDNYNGARCLPTSVWLQSSTSHLTEYGDYRIVYEIVLFYDHQRACTIRRTWDDFMALRRGLPPWKRQTTFTSQHDAHGMQAFLGEALMKRPRECALEYFLRRRMEDCTGHHQD